MSRFLSSHRTGMVQHQSTVSYDLETAWPASTGSDSIPTRKEMFHYCKVTKFSETQNFTKQIC